MSNNIYQNEVTIDHDSHVYTDSQYNQYLSTTRFIKLFQEDVNFDMLAGQVAKKRTRIFTQMAEKKRCDIKAISLLQPKYERGYTKKAVQAEWNKKRDVAIEHGSWIHAKLEEAGKTGNIKEDPYTHYYNWFMKGYARFKLQDYEQVVYYRDEERDFYLAGMMDFSFFRKGEKSMFCIRDFKTNNFTVDTMKYDKLTAEWKNYDRQLTGPLNHLEDCDYNKYALQQSIYAYMCEQTLGLKIGNLAIIAMPWENRVKTPRLHYLPYLKLEVQAMIEWYIANHKKTIIFDADTFSDEEYHEQISL